MNIEQVKRLAAQGESDTLEYKISTAKLKDAMGTVCAYLNNKGGTVLIGVKNDGTIVGQDVTDNTRLEIANEIKKIEPSAFIDVHYVEVKENKFVIAIHVEAGNHVPYIYDGRPYHRVQSSTSKMSQHHYEQLLVKRGQLNYSWEELPTDDYTIDDLDHDEIRLAVEQGIAANRVPAIVRNNSIEAILKNWKLIREDGRLNNAAVVLFAKEVFPRYAQCHMKMGMLRGNDMLSGFIDNRQFFGNAFRMFYEASNFIMKHLPIASFFEADKFERIDQPALPALAVREALTNAICHCDYSNRSASITVIIFNDRLEIWNYGKLPSELKFQDLKKPHKSIPKNIIIASVFYDRKFFDGWGKGTIEMFDICRANDVPEPKFDEYSGGVAVTFKFREPIGVSHKIEKKQKLTARQREILMLLEKDSLNAAQIIHQLKDNPTVRTIQKDLAQLEKAGFIKREGKARAMVWTVIKEK